MKRFIVGMLFFFGLLAGASYSVLCADQKPQIADLAFANVEALAQGEGGITICFGRGEVDCYGDKVDVMYIGVR